MCEVLVGVAAAKGIKGPIELRIKTCLVLAVSDEIVGDPGLWQEHIGLAVLRDGHDHLVAHLIVPSVVVEAILALLR